VVPVYKTRSFGRYARDEKIDDKSLIDAVTRAAKGLVDADLTGGLIKQRVARQGQGRRSGYRVLIAFRSEEFAVFLFGFAKNVMDNIDPRELRTMQEAANSWLRATPEMIQQALDDGRLTEVRQ
jgi:hypothetical protein